MCIAVLYVLPLSSLGALWARENRLLPLSEDAPCSNGALSSPCARAHPHSQFPFLPLPLSNPLDFKCHSQAAQAFGNNLPWGVGAPSTVPSCSGASGSSWFASSGSSSPSHIPLITSFHFHSIALVACVWRKCHKIQYQILETSLGQLKLFLIIDGCNYVANTTCCVHKGAGNWCTWVC